MFSKLAYAMIKKWEIKVCISVNIYHRLPKLVMSTHAIIKDGKFSKLSYAMINHVK